jgi:dipeptide/tripeptide permease
MNNFSFGNIVTGIFFLIFQLYKYFDNHSIVSKPHVVLGFLLIAIGIWGHFKSKKRINKTPSISNK